MEYEILSALSQETLEELVNDSIGHEWIPQGGVVTFDNGGYVAQAMIRYSETDTPTPAPEPEPTVTKIVTADKAVLRCVATYNGAGYPRWKIYGGLPTSNRLRFLKGAAIEVYPENVRADGGQWAYRVVPGQYDSYGKKVTDEVQVFVLKANVE